ncbi:MAG: hypothetical protein C0594_18030 [Marinilabiliales bacterium]|nr:MAG: hypothetical protein C0594_18030 [Marinilabiliales bacterium]
MKHLLVIILIFSCFVMKAQTVIEMTHPDDADFSYLVVDDIDEADFVVYKTDSKEESNQWDFMWRFKKWGYSNFAVYLTKNPNDPLFMDNDEGVRKSYFGKVYFTDNKEERGIRKEGFILEGIMRRLEN